MAQPNHESIQGFSEDSTSPNSTQVFHHVLRNVMDIKNEDEIVSISKWMKYVGYENFPYLCVDFHHELYHIHDSRGYRVDGQNYVLKFGTMNKLKLLIKWISTRMKDSTFELSAEYILALTYKKFNIFRQADMPRICSKPTSPPPPPLLTRHTPGSQTRKAFLPQPNDVFDRPDSESAEAQFDQEKVDSSPFLTFSIFFQFSQPPCSSQPSSRCG